MERGGDERGREERGGERREGEEVKRKEKGRGGKVWEILPRTFFYRKVGAYVIQLHNATIQRMFSQRWSQYENETRAKFFHHFTSRHSVTRAV